MKWKWKVNRRSYLPSRLPVLLSFNSKWKIKVIVLADGAPGELLPRYKSILFDMLIYLSICFNFEFRSSLVILQDINDKLLGEERFIVSLIDDDYEDEKDYRTILSISYRMIPYDPIDNVIGRISRSFAASREFCAWFVAINTSEIYGGEAYGFLAEISSWIGCFIKTKGALDDKDLFMKMHHKALKILLDNYRLDNLNKNAIPNIYIDDNRVQLWETGDKGSYFKYQTDPKFGYWADTYEDDF